MKAELGFEYVAVFEKIGFENNIKSMKGKLRFGVDYGQLNQRMIPNRFMITNMKSILDDLKDVIYFTLIVPFTGYCQINLNEKFNNEKNY